MMKNYSKKVLAVSLMFLGLKGSIHAAAPFSTPAMEEEFDSAVSFLNNNLTTILERVPNLSQKMINRIEYNIGKLDLVGADNDVRCKRLGIVPYMDGKQRKTFIAPSAIGIESMFKVTEDEYYRVCYTNLQRLYTKNSFCAMNAMVMSMAARTKFKILPKTVLKAVNKSYSDLELATVQVCQEMKLTHQLK